MSRNEEKNLTIEALDRFLNSGVDYGYDIKSYLQYLGESILEIVKNAKSEDLQMKTLYISKDAKSKGSCSYKPNAFKNYRTCSYYGKSIRNAEAKILDSSLPLLRNQHGFRTERNVINIFPKEIHGEINLINFDLKNAFEQINSKDLFSLFSIIDTFSMEERFIIVEHLTNRLGRMFQGGVFSPILYNIFQMPMLLELDNYVSNNKGLFMWDRSTEGSHVKAISYADDLTIVIQSSKSLKGFEIKKYTIQRMMHIIRKYGWDINPQKTLVYSKRVRKSILGLALVKTGDNLWIRVDKKKGERKKNIRLCEFLLKKQIEVLGLTFNKKNIVKAKKMFIEGKIPMDKIILKYENGKSFPILVYINKIQGHKSWIKSAEKQQRMPHVNDVPMDISLIK